MSKVYIARQPIKNINGKTVGYELLYRDTAEGIKEFPEHLAATSHVLINSLTHLEIEKTIGKDGLAFINVDAKVLEADILDLLDSERYVIEILEDTIITPTLISKLRNLKQMGFKIAVDDFDASSEMVKRFNSIWKYVDILKVDVLHHNPKNLEKLLPKFKKMGIKLLAEKVENKEVYLKYKDCGFTLFQGWHLGKPEVLECESMKDATQMIILKLVSIIRSEGETDSIEGFIKKRPELIYNILKFINNQVSVIKQVRTITQAITLLGRNKLSKWLMIYLYSEVNGDEMSEGLLSTAVQRAEEMEKQVEDHREKDMAFMVGMFSMVGDLFEAPIEDVLKNIKADPLVVQAIVNKKGKLGTKLIGVEIDEREKLLKLFNDNYKKIESSDLIKLLETSNVSVEFKKETK